MRVSMRKFFNSSFLKVIPIGLASMYLLKSNFSNKMKCEVDDEGHLIKELEDEISEDDGIKSALSDPSIPEEEKRMLRKQLRQQSIQPPQYSKMDNFCKICLEDDKWTGLRGVFDWVPNNMNKIEYTLTLDSPKLKFNNYKVNLMSVVPYHDHSHNGAIMIGRKCPKMKAIQAFLNISENVKVHLVSQHPKEDMNQGYYAFEYVHDFERMNFTYKFSNMDSSVSLISPIYKNIFLGFEARKVVNLF